jgi:hypothetical protein
MIDINGQYFGQLFGQDRVGQTTPDLESSEWLRPWLPVAYPAPYLPMLRQDQGHPKLASIVIGASMIVGQDKNGGLVPAGLNCGTQPLSKPVVITNSTIEDGIGILEYTPAVAGAQLQQGQTITLAGLTNSTALNAQFVIQSATASQFSVIVASETNVAAGAEPGTATGTLLYPGAYNLFAYSMYDVKFAYNPQTSARVAAAGEYAVIAAPADAAVGDQVTLPSGQVITIKQTDITFAQSCDLFSTGKARPIGCAVRNVYQYLGGVLVGNNNLATPSATGINYVLDGVVPVNFTVLNYMHEMGTAVQTQFVLKLPWIGATPTTLNELTAADGIIGFQQGLGRTFTHFTGNMAAGWGNFSFGTPVVASCFGNGTDAGNFAPYNPAIHTPGDIVGRVIGIQNLNPVGFLNRVRTQFDRPMVGPMVDPNPAAIRMGGSSTRGIPYHISVTTDAVFVYAIDQNKPQRPQYSTHVIVRVNL